MAGGRKNQKQKRKKNWRAVLEGCFNRSPFGGGSAASKNSLVERNNNSSTHTPTSKTSPKNTIQKRPVSESALELSQDKLPLRGILKKSPTISSYTSATHSEPSADFSDSFDSPDEWPRVRSAYLLHCAGNSTDSPHNIDEFCDAHIQNSKQERFSKTYQSEPFLDASREGPSCSRLEEDPQGPKYCKVNPHDGSCNYAGVVLRNRSHEQYQGQNPGVSRACRTERTQSIPNTPRNGTKNNRWSFPGYENEETYSRPLPVPPDRRPVSASFIQDQYPSDTYIPLEEIHKRKQQKQHWSQQRPVSVPVPSWLGRCSVPSLTKTTQPHPAVPFSMTTDMSLVPRIVYNLVDNDWSESKIRAGRYLTSAHPRSRDPIRKPMGSQLCPYSRSLYKTTSPNYTDSYQSAEHLLHKPTETVHGDDEYHHPNESAQTVEVSHIYATVTRSSTKAATSSYIYASISWKSSNDSEKSNHSGTSYSQLPHDIPLPSVPGNLLSKAGHLGRYSSYDCHRAPLPSYEEVIESRIRYGIKRPKSWSESSFTEETERKRGAFLQLLAQRYPQYADRIQRTGSSSTLQGPLPDKPNRSREGQRRRQALVAYNPNVSGNSLEYDDLSTMTDVEASSFQRGGFSRASLPVVRSASTSLERPLGLVFLVYGDQTKKSLLPNEITSLDTVRALFVRAFPDLTLETLENPRKKIYLLDPATNIYFQLEDLADIKDRSVLKLHETDNDQPQKVKERQEVRGRTVQMPASRSHSFQTYDVPFGHKDMFIKSQSLPPQAAHNYPDMIQDQRSQYERERRSRSRTPEPPERSQRSNATGSAAKQRFSHSPDRLPTPDRLHLNPIPENRQISMDYVDQGNFYETVGPGSYRGQYPSGIYDSVVPYHSYPTASAPMAPHQAYVACNSRAIPMAYPPRAIQPGMDINAGFQRSQSYRVPPAERDGKDLSRSHSVTPSDDTARNRIEKMEQQLASLTAWVHYQKDGTRRETIPAPRSLGRATSDSSDTFPASSASKHKDESTPISTIATSTNHVVHLQGLSDTDHDASSGKRSSGLSSRESTPVGAHTEISVKLAQLKSDLHVLRRQQQLNMEAMKNEFVATSSKIKKVLSSFPEAENQESFRKRSKATITKSSYVNEKQRIDQELGDIEASVEELRADVISKQCRVNTSDVEGIALMLSKVTKALADLKVKFAEIHGQMKHVLDAEKNILVSEERFLIEEPTEIENSLERCNTISQRLLCLTKQGVTSGQGQSSSNGSRTEPSGDVLFGQRNNHHEGNGEFKQGINDRKVDDTTHETKEKVNAQQDTVKFFSNSDIVSKNYQWTSLTGVNGMGLGMEKRFPVRTRFQSHQERLSSPMSKTPTVTTPTTVSASAISQMSIAAIPQMPTAAITQMSTASTVPSTSAASSIVSVKPSFSVASTTTKLSEKPTAAVSAMTAAVSETFTSSAIISAASESGPPVMKNIIIPLVQTTERTSSNGGSETGSPTAKEEAKSPKNKDTTVYTYQVCGPVNPVFPIPPVFNNSDNTPGSRTSVEQRYNSSSPSDKATLDQNREETNRPQDSSLSKSDTVKKGSVSFSDPPATNFPDRNHPNNGHTEEKADIATQKQTARNAFFSSLNSPMSPSRHSANLDPGPVLSPLGVTGKLNESPTINLVLTGSVSPMSPTSAGTFNISPPRELNLLRSSVPALAEHESNSLNDSQSSNSSDSSNKQKKVPPPPPPRHGSRPTSASIPPLNGVNPDLSIQQSKEMPRFVGGILGQHRLSGGPLFSTPKAALEQKPANEQDSVNGNYINTQQSDVKSQTNFSQTKTGNDSSLADRNNCGSNSSSGTISLQQNVSNIVRSSSVSVKDSNKSKPDPPRRHSSLLAKLTGSKESKNKINNGKAKINGVDF